MVKRIFFKGLTLKIFLDDERSAPEGWVQCHWPNEVIELLMKEQVTHLSLDHDLGDDVKGTGYTVLQWIEEQVVWADYIPPQLIIHTANPAARARMEAAVISIKDRSKNDFR